MILRKSTYGNLTKLKEDQTFHTITWSINLTDASFHYRNLKKNKNPTKIGRTKGRFSLTSQIGNGKLQPLKNVWKGELGKMNSHFLPLKNVMRTVGTNGIIKGNVPISFTNINASNFFILDGVATLEILDHNLEEKRYLTLLA